VDGDTFAVDLAHERVLPWQEVGYLDLKPRSIEVARITQDELLRPATAKTLDRQ
jgi:hypothetical protein